jgi:hypothetical protein
LPGGFIKRPLRHFRVDFGAWIPGRGPTAVSVGAILRKIEHNNAISLKRAVAPWVDCLANRVSSHARQGRIEMAVDQGDLLAAASRHDVRADRDTATNI